jgi:creatinine deaminase
MVTDLSFLETAKEEAKQSLVEGGSPEGAVLVYKSEIYGQGRNRLMQRKSAILHAEICCFEDAGPQVATFYQSCALYCTLSPCPMCCGAIVLFGIPRVVIGENTNYRGPEDYLLEQGIEVEVVNDPECIAMMSKFIEENPELWRGEIT